jgi:hypothetical protein
MFNIEKIPNEAMPLMVAIKNMPMKSQTLTRIDYSTKPESLPLMIG